MPLPFEVQKLWLIASPLTPSYQDSSLTLILFGRVPSPFNVVLFSARKKRSCDSMDTKEAKIIDPYMENEFYETVKNNLPITKVEINHK